MKIEKSTVQYITELEHRIIALNEEVTGRNKRRAALLQEYDRAEDRLRNLLRKQTKEIELLKADNMALSLELRALPIRRINHVRGISDHNN